MQKSIATVAISLAVARTAAADTVINTYPDWDGNVTSGWRAVAQSFTAPADNVLADWTFALAAAGSQPTVQVDVYAWSNSSGPVGPSLYTTIVPWPSDGGDVTVSGINLPLATGGLYSLIVDLQGYAGSSVHWQPNQNSYTAGDASWYNNGTWSFLNSNWNTKFRGHFVPAPATLALLAAGGLLTPRRR